MISLKRDGIAAGARRTRTRSRPAVACERLEGRELLTSFLQDVMQLEKDVIQVYHHSKITPAEIGAVAVDFMQVGMVVKTPSAASVATLKAELVTIAGTTGGATTAELADLQNDEAAVLVSANVSTKLAAQTAADINAVITAGGVTSADVKTIATDVVAIVNDLGGKK